MPPKIRLEGQVFGRLTVLREEGRSKRGSVMWYCKCSCGKFVTANGVYLRRGEVKSCGCLQPEIAAKTNAERAENLVGMRFGRLVVVSRHGVAPKGEITWLCKCDCNNDVITYGTRLRSGTTKSCGCLARDLSSERNSTHRLTGTRTWKIWSGMKTRCSNKNVDTYKNYGGRGIKVCNRWIHSFENFLEDMGERPYGMTLDRIDFNGDYEPSNCRWATTKEQANNKSTNRFITYNGETKTITGWSKKLGISTSALDRRIKKWSMKDAFTKPPQKQKRERI